jgi:hypothetical protein
MLCRFRKSISDNILMMSLPARLVQRIIRSDILCT